MKQKILVIDTETAGFFDKPRVYDFGYAVVDREGVIYEKGQGLVRETICNAELMNTAYYKDKLPLYRQMVRDKKTKVMPLEFIYHYINDLIKKYNIKIIAAYNANFDINALNQTIAEYSNGFIKQFFPDNVQIWCIWNMACQAIFTSLRFQKKAIKEGWLTEKKNFKTSAEIAYRYLKKDEQFEEDHMALSDVLIEVQIMVECLRKHCKMERGPKAFCWKVKKRVEIE